MIEETLKKLGLGDKERAIYLILLKIGLSNATQIAGEVGFPRQTVYSVLEGLVGEGFVEQSDKRGVRQFFADPNQLISLVESRKNELEKSKKVLEEEVPKLLIKNRRGQKFPVVQYYEGREGLKRLFQNILGEYEKGREKIFRGYGINFFYEGLEDFLKKFIEKRAELEVDTNLFIAQGPDGFGITGSENTLRRNIKKLNIEPQDSGIYLVGNKAYFFSYKDNVGVMIENPTISNFLRAAFDDHWKKS